MIRKILQMIAGAFLVFCAFWNLHIVDDGVAGLQPRSGEDVVVLQNQYTPIEYAMIGEHPAPKRIGYLTANTLKGEPLDSPADLRWCQLRYVMIPRILVKGTDEPYVLGDFKKGEPVPLVPENLVMVYDSGNGMILYKQKQLR